MKRKYPEQTGEVHYARELCVVSASDMTIFMSEYSQLAETIIEYVYLLFSRVAEPA